jgi:hypothetical protein
MAEILFRELSFAIIGAAMEVHKILGPGFLEAVYHTALAHEFNLRGIPFNQHIKLPVTKTFLSANMRRILWLTEKFSLNSNLYLTFTPNTLHKPTII